MTVLGYDALAKELEKRGEKIPERTLRTLAADGKISNNRLGHRTVRFDVDKVQKEIAR